MATGMIGLERTIKVDAFDLAVGAESFRVPEALAAPLSDLDVQINELQHEMQQLQDRAARRGRREARADALRTEVVIAEEEWDDARGEASATSRSLARWLVGRGDTPAGSIADRQEDIARAETRLRGLRARLEQAERELQESDENALGRVAAVAPRLRRLLEQRLELLTATPGVPEEMRREAAYDLAVRLRKGLGWLEQVCDHLESVRRHVDNIAAACAPRRTLLGRPDRRRRRRTLPSVEEEYYHAQRTYKFAADAAHSAQLSLGLMLGVPHRSDGLEELGAVIERPRDALQQATIARWELSHRLGEARTLLEQTLPLVHELDRRASPS